MRLPLLLIITIVLSLARVEPAHALGTVAAEIRRSLAGASNSLLTHPLTDDELAAVRKIYASREFRPLWSVADEVTPQARAVVDTLDRAEDFGLRPADYQAATLAAQIQDFTANDPRLAQFDLALSIATRRFLTHLHYGRISAARVGFELGDPHQDMDSESLLEPLAASADVPTFIARVEPRFHHYALLKTALQKYRRLAADATLTLLPPLPSRSIKPGERYDGANRLRALLTATGDLPATTDALNAEQVLDPMLSQGLSSFQRRHGLATDGALGKQTYAALTTPFAFRVRQIELTLERWRWLPEFNSPPIIVNIPQFKVFAFARADDREEDFLQMDVIVGKSFPHTRTPVFTGDMKYVVFRPFWDVPYSIVKHEMMTPIRERPGYLDEKHLEIVSGQTDAAMPVAATPDNIDALAAGKLRLRQRPGPDNALGTIKFMLPNSHNVYLHSTPEHQLFGEARRTFSHGCIRVSDPVALAEYVLRAQTDPWPRERIEAAMNGEPARRVNLDQPIRVMVLYGTAVAAESGNVYFFDDVYGHDRKLEKLLETARPR